MSENVLLRAAEALGRVESIAKSGDAFVRMSQDAIRQLQAETAKAVAASERTQTQLQSQVDAISPLQQRLAASEVKLQEATQAIWAASKSLAAEGETIGARVDEAREAIQRKTLEQHRQALATARWALGLAVLAAALSGAALLVLLFQGSR